MTRFTVRFAERKVRMRRTINALPLLVVLGLVASACGTGGGDLLSAVRDRGRLVCGVNETVPGFGFKNADGSYSGFDIDFCRAVAAGVTGDANAVDFVSLSAEARFTALDAGEVDVLIRNTTWTASRDGAEGAAFATTTFYDGQGMMVKADSEYQRLEDMENTTICVLSGTTTELNLESVFKARKIKYKPLSFESNDQLQPAFERDRCEGWTSDKSQLAGLRSSYPENRGGPDALRILDATMSKEPLGPVVSDGDQAWFDAVNWIVIATIQAEELGITKRNVADLAASTDDPEIKRFLGVASGAPFDPELGLDADFVVKVIGAVGNYGEIYQRNVGKPLGLKRGLNELWTRGGLHYAPPYR